MKVSIDKVEMRRNWILNRWYEKALFVVAAAYAVLFVVAFTFGFIQGLLGV